MQTHTTALNEKYISIVLVSKMQHSFGPRVVGYSATQCCVINYDPHALTKHCCDTNNLPAYLAF